MRYAFGLVSLLVSVGIVVWLFAQHTSVVSKVAKKETDRTRQMAGRDEATGEDASRALTLEPAQRGSKVYGMTVRAVVPGSAMEKFYGIKPNDVVMQAGDMPFGDPFVSDAQSAAGLILKAFQEFKPLTVQRSGQSISLPLSADTSAPAPAAPIAGSNNAPDPFAAPAGSTPQPAPTPANPKPAPTQKGGLQRQLDIIKGAGGEGAGQ